MVARMPHRKYAYFRDDQVVFLVTHDQEQITQDELNFLKENVDKSLQNLLNTPDVSIEWPETQIFSFPRPTGFELEQEAAILSALLQHKPDTNLSDYKSQVFHENNPTRHGFSIIVGNVTFVDPEQQEALDPLTLIGLIRALRGEMKNNELLFDGLLMVNNISPNWLMGNSSQGGTTGGPGGLPKPFKGTDELGGMQANFSVKNTLSDLGLYGEGENIDVVILDTTPCPHDLVIAHKEWKDHHLLIKNLLGPNGKLRLYSATYDQLLRMYNTSFNSHDYLMSDHGLFIAGIIHTIVPKATIHLIEVLNPFGVGDLLTLVEGFHKVFYEIYQTVPPERKLIVNCSLVLELPLEDDQCYADELKTPAKDKEPEDNVDDVNFEQEVLLLATEDQDTVLEINELCKRLFGVGRQVVAAAGNDWENGKARRRRRNNPPPDEPRENAPIARYPAAFASVIGVGALPKDSLIAENLHKTSSFSNLGDKPAGDGILTLGGEEGDSKGILGLYLRESFPRRTRIAAPHHNKNWIEMVPRRPNQDEENHWAWWSGTSFATPIVTGAIAAILSSQLPNGAYQFDNTQQAVQKLYDVGVILEKQTEADEDVMMVKQEGQV